MSYVEISKDYKDDNKFYIETNANTFIVDAKTAVIAEMLDRLNATLEEIRDRRD